jgi:hypothetical protein
VGKIFGILRNEVEHQHPVGGEPLPAMVEKAASLIHCGERCGRRRCSIR